MIRLAWVVGVVAAAVVVAACGGSGGSAAPDGGGAPVIDAMPPPRGCASDDECAALDPGAGLCRADGQCVACLDASGCADPAAPVCDATLGACRGCVVDGECATGVCDVGEGTCVAASDIYYVDDDAACGAGDGSAASPFCAIGAALAAYSATPRNWVRVESGSYQFPLLDALSLPWFIGAADARLTPNASGTCVESAGPATLELRGFRFEACAIGVAVAPMAGPALLGPSEFAGGGRGIDCQEYCVVASGTWFHEVGTALRCTNDALCQVQAVQITDATDSGLVAVGARLEVNGATITGAGQYGVRTQDAQLSVIATNVSGTGAAAMGGAMPAPAILCAGGSCAIARSRVTNGRGAGIVILDATYGIENTAVLGNGVTDAGLVWNGGVVLASGQPVQRFANNTVAGNHAGAGEVAGVRCTGTGSRALLNSIVWGNDGDLELQLATGGGCVPTACDVDQADVGGVGNFRLDPMLASMTPGAMDEHLLATSPCIDAADAAGAPALDIDGETRPDGIKPDVGADEH